MYLYVSTDQLSHALSEERGKAAYDELLKDLADCGENARLEQIDIARGASTNAFKVLLNWLPLLSPIALFFLGSQIEKNLEAWVSMAKRLHTLIARLRTLGHHPVVTFEAACAVALNEIAAKGWDGPELTIDHIVASNRYVQMHFTFTTMQDLKEHVEANRKNAFDPLSVEEAYTFFGHCGTTLFIVSVDADGSILLSMAFN